MKVVIEADGGSRGNPGPAGYGAVVWTPDRGTVLAENKQAIGRATNNVAEYRGLIAGLDDALKLGATEAEVYLDSKLLVEQMSGRWKVKHPDLIELHAQARGLAARFDRISYSWIPRERNSHADRLANEAMDAAAAATGTAEKPEPAEKLGRAEQSDPTAVDAGKTAAAPSPAAPGWTGARGTPTRLLLLRHGQTELSVQRRYSGRGNPALTETGRRQADAAARYLAARGGISAVFASPLQRAYDTAAVAAKALGLDVTVDDDLIETDFGAWEGLTFGEAAERDPGLHRRWLRDTSTAPPGGESFDSVAERVSRVRQKIIAAQQGSTVLVVSHVTPIKMLLREALDAGPGILYRLHLDLASLSIAEFYSDGAASVRLVNQTGYL
ncbi:bifunctional RNase H/acid phosphatase [Mycobacterium avium]|uniref:bifunctional RNase H/acid phosphatase n=1 Tax=Mycobacterium avium TaxID=1764 RepID=UPI0001B5A113|nr:bifunctional RNase H/acid phosphatase [Mycobacterium avium]AYJ05292.1 bifunctional RNase H/acid phosphatase [Mycobacterium avium]MDV3264243.1 bifunctional RNase H/acid phosphatase [Mycobacterium avium]QGW32424.1 Phosphoserine phosphatase 1 [Mycobacterium avium subsp. avium]UEA21873.1 bifunctional RNase H/acid phosphatase [Mycobacterium avium subsp. avium]UEA35918.1 bifunctional RNase H/acid phosphatase [Mycobacterium avium subsp. avium]